MQIVSTGEQAVAGDEEDEGGGADQGRYRDVTGGG